MILNQVEAGLSAGRMAYVARCLSKGDSIKPNKALSPHQEPTWGDRQIVLDCARHYNPSNINDLENGLLYPTRSDADMRLVRNATAHICKERFDEVRLLSAYYSGSKLVHPVEMMEWHENSSGDFAFEVWLADLQECADLMTS